VYTGTGEFPYLRSVAFEPDGSHMTCDIRGLGPGPEATYRVEIATGQAERRPYVKPSWNTARSRVLAFGVDDDVPRVFDADGETLLELPAAANHHNTHAALSPSGRLAAVARYATSGGKDCALGVWDVDSGNRLLDVPFPYPSDLQDGAGWFQRLEFDASEKILVASTGPGAAACFGVSVETGDLCWTVEDPDLERGRYQAFDDVVLSPDRALLAGIPCGFRPILVCDVATGQRLAPALEVPEPNGPGSRDGVSFSGDGRLLAVAGSPGLVTVFRLDGLEFTKA
jgi:WD40 repeat protein